MDHLRARQVRGQRLAAARLAIRRLGTCRARTLLPGLLGAGVAFRHGFLEFTEHEFELLDLPVELLGGAAEPRPSQHCKLRLEMLDLQRLGIEFRVANRDHAIAFGELRLLLGDDPFALDQQRFLLAKHSPQRAGIARKCRSVRDHAHDKN